MLSWNFKSTRTAAASRGFLATARLSCVTTRSPLLCPVSEDCNLIYRYFRSNTTTTATPQRHRLTGRDRRSTYDTNTAILICASRGENIHICVECQTRKPCCRQETARCRSCSFRFKVRRRHSLQLQFKSSHASFEARLQSSKRTGTKQNITQNGDSRSFKVTCFGVSGKAIRH